MPKDEMKEGKIMPVEGCRFKFDFNIIKTFDRTGTLGK